MDPLALEFGIQVNYASLQEHVLEAKSNNRVIKERIRTTYHLDLPQRTTRSPTSHHGQSSH
jgi:hypothetical protein